jgi:Phage tail lysozyme
MTIFVPVGLREFADPFLTHGYSLTGTSAICANGWLESGIRAVNPSHDGSDGVLQWRDALDVHRLTQMKKWCAAQLIPWASLTSQALFTIWDLENNYQELNAQLHDPSRPLDNLTLNFCDIYERPAPRGRVPDVRIGYANRCLAELKRLYPPSPPVPLPPSPSPQLPQPWVPAMNPALINILVQVLAPIAEGLLSAVFKHAGVPAPVPMPPLHPQVPPVLQAPAPPPSPFPPPPMPQTPPGLDWSQIAVLIAEEIAKLTQPSGAIPRNQVPFQATPQNLVQQAQQAPQPTPPTNPT